MYTILEEDTWDFFESERALIEEHGHLVLGPNFALHSSVLRKAYEAGLIRTFVLRVNAEAKGYCVFITNTDVFQKKFFTADCQAMYVQKDYRGRPAIRLIKYAELSLKAAGVTCILMHSQAAQIHMYEKLGYNIMETILRKEI